MKFSQPIAIVGIGGVFPGAKDLDEFWDNIAKGMSVSKEVPEGRWVLKTKDAYSPSGIHTDKANSSRACFIDRFSVSDRLDLETLEIDPLFIEKMDPVYHVTLLAGVNAFSSAVTEGLDRSRVKVIIGNIALPTKKSSELAWDVLGKSFEEKVIGAGKTSDFKEVDPLNRYATGLPAGILAKALGLGGGTCTVDSACSSSLYAIKLACDELLSGKADAVLSGGVSMADSFFTQMGFTHLTAISPDGVCSPFDSKANGLVVGEGGGIFVLKRLDDAIKAGDHIYAIIRGIGLSNDRAGKLLAPSSEGQLRAMQAAYEEAGWSPQDVDIVECHGTGTPVGDEVEVESLKTLWGEKGWNPGQCVIGSVKSNVGHLLTGAGAAGLMKIILALKEKTLPPTANFSSPAPCISLSGSAFNVLSATKPWERRDKDTSRKAAVNGFGFGGTNAHLLVEEWNGNEEHSSQKQQNDDPIAIVGMDAHFGPWESLNAFKERTIFGKQGAGPKMKKYWFGIEETEWFKKRYADRDFRGYGIDEFSIPLGKFRIPPTEFDEMFCQQSLMLKVAARALAYSGHDKSDHINSGCFVGIGLDLSSTNFHVRWAITNKVKSWAEELSLGLSEDEIDEWLKNLREAICPPLTANRVTGDLGSIVASRIAREFQFGGQSYTISNEESSGLRALEAAVRSLQHKDIDLALVGAVDLAGDARSLIGTPYAHAEGFVFGEGAAAVVLKRLEDAENDGDRIYAVVKGIGAATGGKPDAFVPSAEAYATALERAYKDASVDPKSIGFVEMHGSSHPEEDAMENKALSDFFRHHCIMDSVKSKIGHTGSAGGLASLVKTALCLHHEVLPEKPQHWIRNRAEGPRRAGVSSFSVDGNCTHVVLEEYEKDTSQRCAQMDEAVFAIPGNDAVSILKGLDDLRSLAADSPDRSFQHLAMSWHNSNPQGKEHRLAVALVSKNRDELLRQIDQAEKHLRKSPKKSLDGNERDLFPDLSQDCIFYSPDPIGKKEKIAFVFPGSGNNYAGMGRQLSLCWPDVLRQQDSENKYLKKQVMPEHFWNCDSLEHIKDDLRAHIFGHVTYGTIMCDILQSFRLKPDAVVGYSLGESTSLLSTRVWKERDFMMKRMGDSDLFTDELAGPFNAVKKSWNLPDSSRVDWAVGVVNVTAKKVKEALEGRKKVYLLIINTPDECVVGGDKQAVLELVEDLRCNFLPVEQATIAHCDVVKEVARQYRGIHLFKVYPPESVSFYSGSWGRRYEMTSDNAADSILAHAVQGIDFPKTVNAAYDDGARIFIEIGPGASCTRMINKILAGRPHFARSANYPGQNEVSSVLRLLAALIAERVPVDLGSLYEKTEEETISPEARSITVPVGGKPFRIPYPEAKKIKQSAQSQPQRKEQTVAAAPPQPAPQPISPPVPAAPPEPPVHEMPAVEAPAVLPSRDPLTAQFGSAQAAKAQAHETFLRLSRGIAETFSNNLAFQMKMLQETGTALPDASFKQAPEPTRLPTPEQIPKPTPPVEQTATPITIPQEVPRSLNKEQCMEFAIGKIGNVLGPKYAEIDNHPTRVRLPDEPMMFVDRILEIEGEPLSLTSGRVVTEHDVLHDGWYLDGGRIPTCDAVEAGQADLFLSGFLGIDLKTKGLAVYRLLDATVSFHDHLPEPGDIIRYDIRIVRFFKHGETYFFIFEFDGTVNGKLMITMRNGCAGFFTKQELDAGQGIVLTSLDKKPMPKSLPDDWIELVPMSVESYSDGQINALRSGDLEACFGPLFKGLNMKKPCTIPGGKMKMIDRVQHIDPKGGRYGLGLIRAEADIHPDDWFLTCHFSDDNVMPGTLMYECCMHALRIFLIRMGWVAEDGQAVWEPLPGVNSSLKCRGQVIESTKRASYEIIIKELGYSPEPYAIADAFMYADGRMIVEMDNMSIRLTGATKDQIFSIWKEKNARTGIQEDENIKKPAIYDDESILAFAIGNPSEAFGEPYKIFDKERVIARLPGPPYKVLDRITEVNAEKWKMVPGGTIEAQYDVPADAWYFSSNRQGFMSFAVLLEVALQPCGWYSSYMGSALTSENNLHYRNLGGSAVQYEPIPTDAGILTTKVRSTNVSSSGGMIIQHFDFDVQCRGRSVYKGNTYFGFFSDEALEDQIGIRDAKVYKPTRAETARAKTCAYPTEPPFPDDMLRMIDNIELFVPDGGPHGLGFVRGTMKVKPEAWFFKAHFYQDPVIPGSLGLESMLQLMKFIAFERWGCQEDEDMITIVPGMKHEWVYRGQVIPKDTLVTVDAWVTSVDDGNKVMFAEGFLTVDGRIIYQMKDFSLRMQRKKQGKKE